MLRQVGIEPPNWHDVGSVLDEYRTRFAEPIAAEIDPLCEISTRLRKDRELSFCGDIDFIPTDHYSSVDASRAIEDARFVVSTAQKAFPAARPGVSDDEANKPATDA